MERVIITLVAPAAGILPVWSSFAVTFSGVQEEAPLYQFMKCSVSEEGFKPPTVNSGLCIGK